MASLFKTTFSNVFSWTICLGLVGVLLKYVPDSPINVMSSLARVMICRQFADIQLTEPMMAQLIETKSMCQKGPLLLTWINFMSSMDKLLHPL